jgi:hemerythrin-like metal-binding protein
VHYAKWSEALETGDPEVDEQHRALYDLVNDLNASAVMGGDRALVEGSLERILRYAATHFATEEALMERSSYPLSREHIKLHRAFAQAATEKVAAHLAGHDVTLPELARFMEDWLDEHIEQQDRPLIAHVRKWRTA